MPSNFNSSIGAELASLRALGAVRRSVSARDRLLRERLESLRLRDIRVRDICLHEEWGADD